MRVLGIESAGKSCSVAVMDGENVIATLCEKMERGQDARLVPLVDQVMKQARMAYDDLDRIAAVRGPGSFTGLRVGLATARGVGLAAGKPVLGFDRFMLYTSAFRRDCGHGDLMILLDSRRQELFTCFLSSAGDAEEPCLRTLAEITDFLRQHPVCKVAGDAFPEGLMPNDNLFYMPKENEAVLACRLAMMAQVEDVSLLPRPLYLRAPDVTVCRKDAL